MMQRWRKKITQLPLIAIIFLIFILCSILYNEPYVQQIHQNQNRNDNHNNDEKTPLFKLNYTLQKGHTVDRSSKCKSTVNYSGREAELVSRKPESEQWRESMDMCDVFSGKWVFDSTSYRLYNESDCPYMSDQLACHKHGRPDFGYHYWRWEPHGCNLKRWNATELWEKLLGKRLMFVGIH